MVNPAKKKVIFLGDSITQMGVNPGGYINQLQELLQAKPLNSVYELKGAGVGGNKVYDLYLRLEDDVLAHRPDMVVIYVGINDVWHKTSGIGTDIEKFEKFYVAIIKKLQAQKITVMLCTPSIIGEKKNNANPQDADLNAYSDVIRRIAQIWHCGLIDLRRDFLEYEQEHNIHDVELGVLTTDRVHLNKKGNSLVANAILNKLE